MSSAAANLGERFAKSSYRLVVCLLLCGLIPLLTACQSVDPVVKIGLVAPFEGRHREIGYDVLYSARLAVREINEAGGIGGHRVALVALDDGATAEFAESTARSLAVDPAVVAVVGHWQEQTTAAAEPIYSDNGLVLLPGGWEPFTAMDPINLSPDFTEAYAKVTPFDEVPGPYAGPAYEAFQKLFDAFDLASQQSGDINRESVRMAYHTLD